VPIDRKLLCAVTIAWLAAGAPVNASPVTGRVAVKGRGDRGAAPTVVYAEPLDGRGPGRPVTFKLTQRNKAFVPRLLAVPVGSTVEFPNEDQIFHNIFTLSRPNPFDLGLYRAGASKSRVFTEPATYRVFCNIHPQMTAVILVLPTSFIAEVDAAGSYRLDLPPGRYRVTAWSERSQPATADVTVTAAALAVPDLQLDESQYVELPHQNKFGQDYPKGSYDPLKDRKP